MALSDVYMLQHIQRWADGSGEEIQNVYFYLKNTIGFDADDLYTAFFEDVLPFVLDLQTDYLESVAIRISNIGDMDDYKEVILSGVDGTFSSGDAFPMFVAVNFTLRLDTRAVRPGSKRIAGVPEAAAVNGIITDATYISNMNDLRTALAAHLEVGAGPSGFDPIVVKRVKEVDEEGKVSYRLPETDAELIYGVVSGALTTTRLSHQTSRGNAR